MARYQTGIAGLAVHSTPAAAAQDLAQRIIDLVRVKPDAVLGLATGGTMEPVYAALIAAHRDGLSFARVTSFNLDEYLGLPGSHPASYRATMQRLLFDHIDIDPANTHLPNGMAANLAAEAEDYERRIAAAGGIDLQILGIGRNGHIGFNEPGSAAGSRTRAVNLTASTIEANTRFFAEGEAQPDRAITMGIGTIMEAREVAVLATGMSKAQALSQALTGPVGPACPASILRDHPVASWIADAEAVSLL
ncbi:MAG: glucosamine-6-phosphate deaminase [Maritimibacter sp.]